MKFAKLFLFIFFVGIGSFLQAQVHHFVYIESQTKKPFVVHYDNKPFQSDNNNYIILNKLNSGIVNITVDVDSEKNIPFTIPIENNDAGYTLKQNTNNEWVLFDILNFATLTQAKENVQITAVVEKPVVKIEPEKIITENNPSLINKNSNNLVKVENIDSQKTIVEPLVAAKIERIYHQENSNGIEQIYLDAKDTISILIPKKEIIRTDTIKEIFQPLIEEKKMESKNIDVLDTAISISLCPQQATELDYNIFINQLQKIAVIKNKLSLAEEILKTKCFTTSQIQRLSVLFLYDKAKLDFFKMAFQSTSDLRNFHYLENELKDDDYKNQFRALINHL